MTAPWGSPTSVLRSPAPLLRSDGPFNFSAKMNASVAASAGGVLLLLNDDVEVTTPDWIEVFLGLLQQPDRGLVGCKLLFADATEQHAGHVYLDDNLAHAGRS